jgi:hypothetical protein
MERRLEGLQRSEDRAEAERARQEDLAAADLVRVLAQGRSLREVALAANQGVSVLLPGGGEEPVCALGRDYLVSGAPLETLRPLSRTRLALRSDGARPEERADTFHEASRRWARRAEPVHLVLDDGMQRGILRQVGPDCLVIDQREGRVAVPLELVRAIRLARGG